MKPYGAFVDLPNNVSGLLHISQISEERVSNVEDVLSVGDELKVPIVFASHLRTDLFKQAALLGREPVASWHQANMSRCVLVRAWT